MLPLWSWLIFIFAFGCCVGSFLNVVIYRMPRDKSLIYPGSSCPACGKRIRFYDNIPLISWIVLRAKCRYCKSLISPRYFVIELLTGIVFVGLFVLYFMSGMRDLNIPGESSEAAFLNGGWFVYLLHLVLLSSLIVCSAIDLELWVIPVVICWLVTIAGIAGSGAGFFIVRLTENAGISPLPSAGAGGAAIAAGAAVGFIISVVLLLTGLLKRSYETEGAKESSQQNDKKEQEQDDKYNHRKEIGKEVLFVLPIIACSVFFYLFMSRVKPQWWSDFVGYGPVGAVFGSLLGFFAGGAIVWATRIFGTLAFNREAMGLGDVYLMAGAGAIIGPLEVVAAFFIAPFFGLGWASFQLFFKKIRQIPYGPFLSMGILTGMILNDIIVSYWKFLGL